MKTSRFAPVRLMGAALVASLLLVLTASLASAHEHRQIGEYEIVVGFREEPALVNQPNGLDLRVSRGEGDAAEPVEGLENTLTVTIRYGGESKELNLRAAWSQPGSYTADILPTQTGAYTFHITGDINGTPIDEEFTSGPDTFSEVAPIETIAFPAMTADGDAAAATAQDTADSARTLAIVGIVVGLLGLAVGAAGLMMAMNARNARAATVRTAPETGD
jgi:hypothetical protein